MICSYAHSYKAYEMKLWILSKVLTHMAKNLIEELPKQSE